MRYAAMCCRGTWTLASAARRAGKGEVVPGQRYIFDANLAGKSENDAHDARANCRTRSDATPPRQPPAQVLSGTRAKQPQQKDTIEY